MTDAEVELHNLYVAGRIAGMTMSCNPEVLDRLAMEKTPLVVDADSLRVTAALCRVLRGDKSAMNATESVRKFIGQVAAFLSLFDREAAGDIACKGSLYGSKMHGDLATALNELRALFEAPVQTSVKGEGDHGNA